MRKLALGLIIAGLAACSPAKPAAVVRAAVSAEVISAESAKLTAYLNAEYEKQLVLDPEQATQMGRKDNYDKLTDRSEAADDKWLAWRRKSVADMKAQFDTAKLSEEAQTSYDIWALELDQDELRTKYRRHSYIFANGGPHVGLPNFLMTYHKVDAKADMDAYVARLGALGSAIDQSTERAKLAAGDGIRAPRFAYDRTIREAQSIITGQPFAASGPASPLWEDTSKKIKALIDGKKVTVEEGKALEAATRKAMVEQVKPAYERLIAWLKSDADKAQSGKVGVLTQPDGAAWYNASLKLLTTTDMTANEIHKLGLSEVARIHKEIEAIKDKVGFKGDLKAFFEYTRNDPKFYLPNTDAGRAEYLKRSEGFIAGMKPKLPEYFGRLPKADLIVKRVEAFREEPGGAAHYYAPTPDGKQPGIFYSHMSEMKALALWAQEAVTYHEGIPGHHMQIAIAGELTDLPVFRTQYGYTAYTEGWGLYAEGLAKEMGFYTDPYGDFGRLASELWRAVRLVEDTGLHAQGWTEEEGVKYALDNSPKPKAAVESEVRRYLSWPGQATCYKIGQLTILRLREEAKAALGPKFDIRGFHDTVVDAGSLPLPVLEKRVHRWVDRQKAA